MMAMNQIKSPLTHHYNNNYTGINENRSRTFEHLIYCSYEIYKNVYIDVSFNSNNLELKYFIKFQQ